MPTRGGKALRGRARHRKADAPSNPIVTLAAQARSGQKERHALAATNADAYRFLLAAGFDRHVLGTAIEDANRTGVALHRSLVALGLVADDEYAGKVGRMAGIAVVDFAARVRFEAGTVAGAGAILHPALVGGGPVLVAAADVVAPQRLWELGAIAEREG